MGQTLSEPVVDKHSDQGHDSRLAYGVSEMQGWRLTMEDAHATVLSLDDPQAARPAAGTPDANPAFFAVYDGHGGATVARFAGDTVHQRLRNTEPYKRKEFEASLKRAFLSTDEDLRTTPEYANDPSGCTAVACLILPDRKILCANAGDSRSVLCVGGEAKPMSYDHKPVNKGENSRIVAAGGFVEFGRVNGNLALSRALGDFEFKQNSSLPAEQQIVTADPDIIVHDPTDEDEFLILACDGIWDVVTSQQAVDFVRRAIADRVDLPTICERLMDRCLAPDSDWGGVGCDNMTVVVVALLNGRGVEGWYDWVGERVESEHGYKTPKSIPNPFAKAAGGPGGRGGAPAGIGRGASPLANILSAATGAGAPGSLASRLGVASPEDEMDVDDEDDEADDAAAFQAAARRDGAASRETGASGSATEDADESTPTATPASEPVVARDPVTAPPPQRTDSQPTQGHDAAMSDKPSQRVAAAGEGMLDGSDDPVKNAAA